MASLRRSRDFMAALIEDEPIYPAVMRTQGSQWFGGKLLTNS